MAEGMSVALANACLGNEVNAYTWIKLHVGPPGAAGTANPATNTARQQATWGTPSGGVIANTNTIVWEDVPAAEDYTHFSVWSASVGGTFGWSGTITANAMSVGDDATAAPGAFTASLPVAS